MEMKTESKNRTAENDLAVFQGMKPCLDYFVMVRRTDPTFGARRALQVYLHDNGELACQLAQELAPEGMPVDFDTLQEHLKALGGVDAFSVGRNSWNTYNPSSDWFQISDDRIESMSQLKFEKWSIETIVSEYSDEIIDGGIEVPAQLRAVLDLWGPDGTKLCRQYPCKYLDSEGVASVTGFEFPLPCRLYGTSVHGADVEDCETMEDVQAFLRHPHYGAVQIVTGDDPRTWAVVPAELCNLRPIGDRDSDEDDIEGVA